MNWREDTETLKGTLAEITDRGGVTLEFIAKFSNLLELEAQRTEATFFMNDPLEVSHDQTIEALSTARTYRATIKLARSLLTKEHKEYVEHARNRPNP